MLLKTVLTLLLCLCAAPAGAAAEDAEAAWAALLAGKPGHDGTLVWLQTAQRPKVLALYRAARGTKHHGTVILLHDMGQHPDWPRVVAPLRDGLADHGWASLSVQMPVLPRDQGPAAYAPLFAQVAPRIQAALAYLKDKQPGTIVLTGYGLGAAMAAAYLSGTDPGTVKGLVAIGMLGVDGQTPPLDAAALLAKLKLPVLDIYGSRDLEPVLREAAARAQASQGAGTGTHYSQEEITGADHRFTGMSDILIDRVAGWLNRLDTGDTGSSGNPDDTGG